MRDSLTMVIKVTCPVCEGKDSHCMRCGGHGVIGVSKEMIEKPDRVPGGLGHAVAVGVKDMIEKPDRAPGKNPMDAVDPALHKKVV